MTSKKLGNKRLGKGLSALLGEEHLEDDIPLSLNDKKKSVDLIHLNVDDILPNPDQPRRLFDEDKLKELSESIKNVGIIEPVVVYEKEGKYCLIAGERRWRASKLAGFPSVPAVIKNDNKNNGLEMMLIENIQREDLSPIEEATSYQIILERKNITQEKLAKFVGKSRVYITNLLRILKLPLEIKEGIEQQVISVGHAKVLVGLNKVDQHSLFKKITQQNLSVREVEKIVQKIQAKHQEKKINSKEKPLQPNAHIQDLENKIRDRFKTKISIKESEEGIGKIEVNYYNYEDLEIILKKMGVL